jgi:hypothetical protein
MFGCCNLAQHKYIREDGTVDQDRLAVAVQKAHPSITVPLPVPEKNCLRHCPCHRDKQVCLC